MTLRLAPLIHRHARMLALAALLTALGLGASWALIAYSGAFITSTAIAGIAGTAATFEIFRPGAIIRAFALVRIVARYGERLVAHDAVLRIAADVRVAVYRRLTALAPEPLARWRDGDLLQRIVRDVDTLNESPLRAGLPLVGSAVVATGAITVAAIAGGGYATLVAPPLIAAAVLAPMLTARRAAADSTALLAAAAQRRDGLVDALRGLTTLSLTGAWPRWREDWQRQDRAVVDAEFRQRLRESFGQAIVVALVGMSAWAALTFGGADIPPMWRVAVVLGALATLEALAPATGAWIAWHRAKAAGNRLQTLLDTPPAVTFPATATKPLPEPRGEIRLKGVTFSYPGRGVVIDNLTVTIAPGSRVTITGRSGIGKSTLASLLVRERDPDEGTIELDGMDLRDYPEAELRKRIAYLPQRPHLFAATLRENLKLGDPEADDERLRAVLAAVALDEWFERLPEGFETVIGEYGLGLSGGRRGGWRWRGRYCVHRQFAFSTNR
ncbi:thiol reductant ABC exporter subunit CydC [Tahibacter soli]|uniref:Thiol reductant ABC exporter subunit CydC n=1 Tax=Tahibacter soli TaxID=2983605 RepID=A0A9X3YIP6_9GAMM|nr:thiol reductant ABC exporter subunit CydC [Tahibacter soli]MDC8011825.1 thiol reductant ABC exporter subunit CydC [Tahibacter soli]